MSNLVTYSNLLLKGSEVKRTFEENYLSILFSQHKDLDMAYILDFLHKAQLTGANPVLNQIYLTSYFSKKLNKKIAVTVFSYHFFLSQANQTGELEGLTCSASVKDVFNPFTKETVQELVAVATVKRRGKGETTFKARWSEFYNQMSPQWQEKPYVMIEKTAISNVLRWAFPEALSGMFIEEEMHNQDVELRHIEVEVKDYTAINAKSDQIKFLIDKIKTTSIKEKADILKRLGLKSLDELPKKPLDELNFIENEILDMLNEQMIKQAEVKNIPPPGKTQETEIIESIKKLSAKICEGFTEEQKKYFMKDSLGISKFNDLYSLKSDKLLDIEKYLIEKMETHPSW